jgi:phosphomannomutase
VVVRPSGTEPKLKCYLEVVEDVAGGDVEQARARAATTLAAIKNDVASALALAPAADGGA